MNEQNNNNNNENEKKIDWVSVSLHPGVISFPLWKHTVPEFLLPVVRLIANKSIEQGAATNVYCALARYLEQGGYYVDCGVGQPNRMASDVPLRRDLWDYTESLLAEKGFDMPVLGSVEASPQKNNMEMVA
jgi:hypothetical protein